MKIGTHEVNVVSDNLVKIKDGCFSNWTRDEINKLISLMDDWKLFEIGDYVKIVKQPDLAEFEQNLYFHAFKVIKNSGLNGSLAIETNHFHSSLPGCYLDGKLFIPRGHGIWMLPQFCEKLP